MVGREGGDGTYMLVDEQDAHVTPTRDLLEELLHHAHLCL